jgi:hypothetical protein
MMLGRIVGLVSDPGTKNPTASYTKYVTGNVLKPLGMTSTTLEPSSVPADRLAHGYRWEDGQWKNEPLLANGAGGSMGGMLTTLSDLGRYVGAFLAAWPPRDGAEMGPIRRASLREMQQVWRPAPASVIRTANGGVQFSTGGYAYGLRVSQNCQFPTIVAHSGGLPGFGSQMRWLPEYGVGVIAFGNLTYTGWGGTVDRMIDALAKTGALQPREIAPSPALVDARNAAASLVVKWDDAVADRMASQNLFLDRDKAHRRADLDDLHAKVGACTPGSGFDDVVNALRGTWTMPCERGRARVAITLAPTMPPKVQAFVVGVLPPGETNVPAGACPK